jgi:hypothetical protein
MIQSSVPPIIADLQHLCKETAMSKGFIKQNRSENTIWLRTRYPWAFLLLSLIAERARRLEDISDGLQVGEAYVGDYKAIGGTRKQYRNALEKLQELGFIEIIFTRHKKIDRDSTGPALVQNRAIEMVNEKAIGRANGKAINGTVVKLIDTSVYDPNLIDENQPRANERAIEMVNEKAIGRAILRANEGPTKGHKQERKKERMVKKGVSKTKVFSTPPPSPMGGRVAAGGGSGGGGGGGRKKAYSYPGEISERARAANALTLAERMPISADLFQKWLDEYGTEAVRLELDGTMQEIRSGRRITSPPAYMARRLSNNHEPREAKIYDINSIAP